MSITLARVVNEQVLPQGISRDGSILLDKIDKSQGNSENPPYAQNSKQTLYVPYVNPLDVAVKGYVDLVQTDEVMLNLDPVTGSIGALANTTPPHVAVTLLDSALIAASTLTSATDNVGNVTLAGLVFLSVAPDRTRVILTNASGAQQTIEEGDFDTHNATTIIILDGVISGAPATSWFAQVFANSKLSAVVQLT